MPVGDCPWAQELYDLSAIDRRTSLQNMAFIDLWVSRKVSDSTGLTLARLPTDNQATSAILAAN